MDEARRVRFLVPPMIFTASLLLGAWGDPSAHQAIVQALQNTSDWSKIIGGVAGIIAGGGVVVFATGYLIGTFSYVVLRLAFKLRPQSWGRFHEVALPKSALDQLWEMFDPNSNPDRRQELYAGVAFDHGVLRSSHKGVHQWLFRRWNAFSIAVTSLSGLGLSFPFGIWTIGLCVTRGWVLTVALFAAVLFAVAIFAWRDTMHTLAFMVRYRTAFAEDPAKG